MSGSVPGSKVSVSCAKPAAGERDSMYISPSAPFISRSMSETTVSSMVLALAPG